MLSKTNLIAHVVLLVKIMLSADWEPTSFDTDSLVSSILEVNSLSKVNPTGPLSFLSETHHF